MNLQRLAICVFWVLVRSAAIRASDQPVAYSHRQHIALGLRCLDCHSSADTGAAATIPSVHKCMLCHAKIAASRPEIQKLAAYAAGKHEVPWQRVYGFDPAALVKFQHAPHFRANVDCSRCHGDMTQATTAQRLVKHTMGTCLSCHRENRATEDCAACHY
ncbi:MAG TPA: cytochrome c3 family protein [Verrucomicrobiae bacterium]|nr:cytochrome c3 family protein [Verrucomicrobiae bacterium]